MERPRVTAIMPVFDGRRFLERSLPPLLECVGADLLEVIVVDDASSDDSAAFAEQLGARVLRCGRRLGPGAARNRAAEAARGEILFFVDSDVVIHPDAPARVREAFEDPALVAVFGSYDDRPSDPSFLSQYANLRHHFTHQANAGEATTFWAGCGAVRREAFRAVGGYDIERFPRPSIEDIELGYRLREAGGRIRLDPEIQGTHLKGWGLVQLVETDVFRRALPWARLLLRHPQAAADLNVTLPERARAAAAGVLALACGLALGGWVPAWAPLAALALAAALNVRLLALFRRRRGPLFALGGLLFHQLYFLYSSAAYAWCWLERRLARDPR